MATPEELEQLRAYGQALLGSAQQPPPPSVGANSPYAMVSPLSIVSRGLQALQGRSAMNAWGRGIEANRRIRVSGLPGVNATPPPGQTPPGQSPPGQTPPVVTGSSLTGDMQRYAEAISAIESSGRYNLVGPTHPRLGRALGRYQVMEANLPSWLREAGLPSMTPEQFLASPQAQDRVFSHRFGAYVNQFGNPVDAAQAWFAGPGSVGVRGAENRRDSLGTTVGRYRRSFQNHLARLGQNQPGQSETDGMMNLGGPREDAPSVPGITTGQPSSITIGQPSPLGETADVNHPMAEPGFLGLSSNIPGFSGSPDATRGVTSPGAPVIPVSSPDAQVGQSGQLPPPGGQQPGNLPPGLPPRVPPNPALQVIISQLRNPTSMDNEKFNQLLQRYQELSAPQSVQVPFGTATYNPLTGELMTFVPSAQQRQATYPGGSVQLDFLWQNGALRAVPRTGPSTGTDAPTSGTDAPTSGDAGTGVRSTLRPFPWSGDPRELAEWGMEGQALGGIAANRGTALAKRIEDAETRGLEAATNIRTLDRIRTATLASANARWTGERLSTWQRQVATFLHNFDTNNTTSLSALQALPYNELLGKLNAYLAAQATSAISARGTNFEFGTFLQQNPNVAQTPQGTLMMLDYLQSERRREQAIGNIAARLAEEGPQAYTRLHRMIEDYDRRNPVYITLPPGVNGYPTSRRLTTQRIPDVGEMKPDGSGSYTAADITAILDALPNGTWYINPRTNQPVARRPRAQ